MESSNVNSSVYHNQNTCQVQQIPQIQTQPVQVIYRTEYMGYAEPMISEIIIGPRENNSRPVDSNDTLMKSSKTESPKNSRRSLCCVK